MQLHVKTAAITYWSVIFRPCCKGDGLGWCRECVIHAAANGNENKEFVYFDLRKKSL